MHTKYLFGQFGEAHDNCKITNMMQECTSSCINLGPTGNVQGTHKFLNLISRKVIKRRNFTPLPMPDSMIDRVEHWAKINRQTRRHDLAYRNRNNEVFGWDNDNPALIEDNAVEPEPSPAPFPAEFPGIALEQHVMTPADQGVGNVKSLARRALDNANIGPNIIPADLGSDDSSDRPTARELAPHQPHIQMNLHNVIFDEEDENADGETSGDEQSDDSDDNYDPNEPTDEENTSDNEYAEGVHDPTIAQDDRSGLAEGEGEKRTRTRTVKLPSRYDDFQMFQER